MTDRCDQVSALIGISLTHAQSYLALFLSFFPMCILIIEEKALPFWSLLRQNSL